MSVFGLVTKFGRQGASSSKDSASSEVASGTLMATTTPLPPRSQGARTPLQPTISLLCQCKVPTQLPQRQASPSGEALASGKRARLIKLGRPQPLQRSRQNTHHKEEKRKKPNYKAMAERVDLTCNGYFCRPFLRRRRRNLSSARPSSLEAAISSRYIRNPRLSFHAQSFLLISLGKASALWY
jgi:hypothetical protein